MTHSRTLTLLKGNDRFVITYEIGRESEVLDHLVELVNRNIGFDWFDAALISHKLGLQIAKELKTQMK